MRRAVIVAVLGLAGCGLSDTEYIQKRVEIECNYALECYPASRLEFYGWTDAATCIAERGPEVTGDAQGCVFDKKKAKDCLKQFEDAACPADGADPVFPVVCDQVFDCAGADTTGGDTDTDTDIPG